MKNLKFHKILILVVILAGIDGEKNCEKNFSVAKKISKEILPKLIKIFAKKYILCVICPQWLFITKIFSMEI